MNIKLFVLGFLLVAPTQKIFAMVYEDLASQLEGEYQLKMKDELKKNDQEIVDSELFLLEGTYAAEESSCCGIGPWQTNKSIADRAEIIQQSAQKNGLTEEHRARVVKIIKEREVLAGEWCCDDRGRCPRLEQALAVRRSISMPSKKDK